MGARANALAKQFEETSQAMTDALGRLSDADWRKATSAEKWTVGVAAHHVARGHAAIANLIKAVASGQSAPNLTMARSEEHTSELQSRLHLVCRLLLEKKKINSKQNT